MKMNRVITTLFLAMTLVCVPAVKAESFFDTSRPRKFINFGARIGFNTSNRTFADGAFVNDIKTSWGTGFNVGLIADLNIREFLSLQPGFFFESRSGDLSNFVEYYEKDEMTGEDILAPHFGVYHERSYYFTIPVVAVLKFNITKFLKWNLEFGPYLQFMLKETGSQNDIWLYEFLPYEYSYKAFHRTSDFGFKMGTSFQVFKHYYIGAHYLAGTKDTWRIPKGGRNKSWMFTIGYDF